MGGSLEKLNKLDHNPMKIPVFLQLAVADAEASPPDALAMAVARADAPADSPDGDAVGTTGLLAEGVIGGEATGAGDGSGLAEGVTEEGAGLADGMSMLGGLGTLTVPPESGMNYVGVHHTVDLSAHVD